MQPTILTEDQLNQVLQSVSPSGKHYGPGRICMLLAHRHSVRSVDINAGCSISNISDQVGKLINPRIEKLGLFIACTKPVTPFKNKFNQKTGEMLWSFYRDQAANDPDYDESGFANELDQLKGKHPELGAEEWEETLQDSGVE
jgi:predicted 2-oxoglutarate/Fe(II)-dependent dioxygenase YbiX